MRAARAALVLAASVLFFAGCANAPGLGDAETADAHAAGYPVIAPIDDLLAAADNAAIAEPDTAAFQARAAGLRARAAGLRRATP